MSTAAKNEKETGAYHREVVDALERLKEGAPAFRELDYFFQTAETHFSTMERGQDKPRVICLGASVPEELIYAAGAAPCWVLGGSARTGAWASDLLPRDADSVSRSMLGFLENDLWDLERDALILIPAVGDSSRKLAYLLERAGRRVLPIDFPPVKDRWGTEKWFRQWELCREALSAHTGRRITARSLRQAAEQVGACHVQISRFLRTVDAKPGCLSGPCRMFILGSYFYAQDAQEWRWHLEALTEEIKCSRPHPPKTAGNVLLLGSPVYFPNYKIPFLIQDAGLHISAQVDYATQKLTDTSLWKRTSDRSENALARRFYETDCSGAYPQNDGLLQAVSKLLDDQPIDGVIYHVLKGQIEYDFELERFEALFAQRGLPVFRLETDYNPQDVEQLRIRLDAFMEMLSQRRFRKEARAV